MRSFILILLAIFFSVSSVHAFDKKFSAAKKKITVKFNEAKKLAQQKNIVRQLNY
jgi:hypothetical protein